MGFGGWLKEQMQKRHLNQPQLAQVLGVNQSTISFWMRDRVTPDRDNAAKLAKIFDVDPSTLYQLLGYDFGQPYQFKVIGPIVEEIDNLLANVDDPEDRELIEERLKHDVLAARDMLEALNQRRHRKDGGG